MNKKNFIGYEYTGIPIKQSMLRLYIDGYKNFGWEIDGTENSFSKIVHVTMKFKCNRKTPNKIGLMRFQQNFNNYISKILSLESLKYIKVSVAVYTI